MTVMQIHSQQWLGTFSSAGNGETDEELQMVVEKCQLYLKNHQLEKGTVRLDGKYGLVGKINIVQKAGLDYFVRGRDYRLLHHPKTQQALKEGVQARWTSPDSNVEREVFDVGFLEDWTDGDVLLKTRVIVTRRPHEKGKRVKVGKLIDGYVYELFLTSHSIEAFTACDVLSLYFGRGGFEKVLGDENVEQAPDRWCSRCAEGQEFWQIINQWVWNTRLRLGLVKKPDAIRSTLWAEAIEGQNATEKTESLTTPVEEMIEERKEEAQKEVVYAEMKIVGGCGPGKGKFSGDDFEVVNESLVHCQAGKELKPVQKHYNDNGNIRIIFGAKASDCRACELSEKCLSEKASGKNGRRVTGVKKIMLGEGESPPERNVMKQEGWCVPVELGDCESKKQTGKKPVLWEDLPGSELRRSLPSILLGQCVHVEKVERIDMEGPKKDVVLTRSQRAHRRLTFEERQARNALPQFSVRWRVHIHGVPGVVSNFLKGVDVMQRTE